MIGNRWYRVEIRTPARQRAGIIDDWTKIDAVTRFNGIGTWSVDMPASRAAELLAAGGSLTIKRQGRVLIAGPFDSIRASKDINAPAGTVSLTGFSWEYLLDGVLAWPDPAHVINAQATVVDARSGHTETMIKQFVNLNAGPGAITGPPTRQISGLTIETDAAHGPVRQPINARMTNLLDLITQLATPDGLGFRIVQTGTSLQFQVYVPRDLSRLVRFRWRLGNVEKYEYAVSSPKATRAIVGDQGSGTSRVFRQVVNTSAETEWGMRREVFVDKSDSTVTAELDQAGTDELTKNGPSSSISITPIDNTSAMFGRDWLVGDIVTAEADGIGVSDIVREARFTVDTSGEKILPTVGTPDATAAPLVYVKLGQVLRSVNDVQRRG